MKREKTYGQKQRAYAKLLIEQGVSYDEILKDSSLHDFNRATLRSMRLRHERKKNATKNEKRNATETVATAENTPMNEQKGEKQPESRGFMREFAKVFHPVDLLYYSCVAIAGAGCVSVLHEIGYAVAGIYFAVAVFALHFVKTRNGLSRLPHLLMLAFVEIIGAVSHISWANDRLWANVKSLPLDIWENKYRNDLGEVVMLYGGTDVSVPFYIACGVAVVMFFCGVYVCVIAIQNSKNQLTIKNNKQ